MGHAFSRGLDRCRDSEGVAVEGLTSGGCDKVHASEPWSLGGAEAEVGRYEGKRCSRRQYRLDTFDKDIFDDEQSWNDDTIVNIIRFMQASKYVSFFELQNNEQGDG